MEITTLKIGQTVYHDSVYQHKEPLKIVGITESKVELEGDFSGGTHSVSQRSWLPLKGLSRTRNHRQKFEYLSAAVCLQELIKPVTDFNQSPELAAMKDMMDIVLVLTSDIKPFSTAEGEFIKGIHKL